MKYQYFLRKTSCFCKHVNISLGKLCILLSFRLAPIPLNKLEKNSKNTKQKKHIEKQIEQNKTTENLDIAQISCSHAFQCFCSSVFLCVFFFCYDAAYYSWPQSRPLSRVKHFLVPRARLRVVRLGRQCALLVHRGSKSWSHKRCDDTAIKLIHPIMNSMKSEMLFTWSWQLPPP